MTAKSVGTFVPQFVTQLITTGTAAVTAAMTTTATPYTTVRITNEGTTTAIINFGTDTSVTASDSAGIPILGGASMVIQLGLKGGDSAAQKYSTLATISASGTPKVRISYGDEGI